MKRLELVDNWKKWHKFWSVRLGLIGTAITAFFLAAPDAAIQVWAVMPDDIKATLPPEFVKYFGVFLMAAGSFARIVKQNKLHEEVKPNATQD